MPTAQLKGTYEVHSIQANNYDIQSVMHEGKKHLVVPVVMMVEGVHSGSHGPLLHTIDELGKFPESWNGIPVAVQHPQCGGKNISANNPEVVEKQTVGRIYNTHVEGGKLKAEMWIDEAKAESVSPTAMTYIRQKRPLDVSVGVFTEDEPVEGDWQGETYTAIARNHRPDHLALLPGGVGACSWADGCGVRANAEGGDSLPKVETKVIKDLVRAGYSFSVNETDYNQLRQSIQTKLDSLDDGVRYHFLQALFEGSLVYEVEMESSSKLFKRSYEYNEETGEVTFLDDIEPVQRKVEYVTMESDDDPKFKRTKFNTNKEGGTQMPDKMKKQVELLIQSEQFEEADAEWLGELDDEKLDKMVSMMEAMKEKKEDVKKEDVAVNKETAIQALREELKTPDQFISILPTEMQDQMKAGIKLHQEKRNELIKKISGYTTAYSEDELKAKSMDDLEKLSSMVPETGNYSVLGGGDINDNAFQGEVLLPPGIESKND